MCVSSSGSVSSPERERECVCVWFAGSASVRSTREGSGGRGEGARRPSDQTRAEEAAWVRHGFVVDLLLQTLVRTYALGS